jgi:formylglycine-generating enzyme required for sulfatase activity
MKLANLDRIESLRRRSFDRVNRGIVKIAMGDVARGYAFAGTITEADEKGLKADSASKGWDKFTKQEKATFYRKAGGDETAEGLMDVAAFLVEGTAGEQDYEQALDLLGKATRLGADTSSCLKYIETLRRAAKESAAARAKGTAPPAKTTEKEKAESAKQEAGAEKKEEPTGRAFDDVYVTTAATGEKIPHPLSRKTYRITHLLKKIDVPEGMVYVPSGKFKMGEKETEHEVYLDAYFIGKYEVTNAEWKAFVDATGFPPPLHWKGGEIPPGKENHPIVYVSWEDIQKYCEWASHGTVREVHLPTEAQWEKAARGPRGHQYPWGDAWDKRLCNSGWRLGPFGFRPNDEADDWKKKWEEWEKSDKGKEIIAAGGDTTAAGSFPKGKCFYGCYDMAGNAYEWCRDWFITNYYTLKDAKRNPQGPTEEQAEEFDFRGHKSKARVLRGGVWSSHSIHCRTIRRYIDCPSAHNSNYGFRVVVSPAP